MANTPEPSVEREKGKLVIEVPRIPSRSTLRKCRARAKVIAAREGVRTEPEVTLYDGRPSAFGGPIANPQGWVFTFLDTKGSKSDEGQGGWSTDG